MIPLFAVLALSTLQPIDGWRVDREVPLERPNGICKIGGDYLIGGLGGLWIGKPSAWKMVSSDPVRQIARQGKEAWVIFGGGSVDKIVPSDDQLYPDVLFGGAKRPWTSCLAVNGQDVIFGGQEGWIDRGKTLEEHYVPELKDDVVMAVCGQGTARWVGTQKTGLLRIDGKAKPKLWNPGNGLRDTWVTDLVLSNETLYVGTHSSGLYRLVAGKLQSMDCPIQSISCLQLCDRKLAVGGVNGAVIQAADGWRRLDLTHDLEATSLSLIDGKLVVTTSRGVYFFNTREPGL